MARRTFYSFHYDPDHWRAQQIRNMGLIEGNTPATPNNWEAVKKGGQAAVQKWIDDQLDGRSCTVVLIGSATAGRKWIDYEIERSWNDGKGVLGIHVHNLKDSDGDRSSKGANPFATFTMKRDNTKTLSSIVKTYDPPYIDSQQVYAHIKTNLAGWIEKAIEIRNNY
jgi:hypothetical protein